jgi:hypothetical protein
MSLIPCPPDGTYVVNLSGGFYSTLASVLAGFAFFAVTYVLTGLQGQGSAIDRRHERRSTENYVIVSLFCAFLALVVAAFLYALISAERTGAVQGGRAISEQLLAGVAFAYGAGILVFSLALLISSVGLEHTAREVRTIVVLCLPTIAVLFVSQAAQDLAQTRILATGPRLCRDSGFYDAVVLWSADVLPLAVLSISVVLVVLSRTVLGPKRVRGFSQGSSWWLHNPLPKLSLAVVFAAAVRSAALGMHGGPSEHLSDAETWVWLAVTAIGLLLQTVVSLWTRPGVPLAQPFGDERAAERQTPSPDPLARDPP